MLPLIRATQGYKAFTIKMDKSLDVLYIRKQYIFYMKTYLYGKITVIGPRLLQKSVINKRYTTVLILCRLLKAKVFTFDCHINDNGLDRHK